MNAPLADLLLRELRDQEARIMGAPSNDVHTLAMATVKVSECLRSVIAVLRNTADEDRRAVLAVRHFPEAAPKAQ